MARKLMGRLRIAGTLVARTPLHVGGYGDDVDTDLPLARDGRGRYYVPGTSLAGALRQWCREVGGNDEGPVKRVWGFQEGDKGHASYVFVEDAVIPDGVAVEVRDGVGIDRVWGCAAEHVKYDRAILPRGTALPLVLTVELRGDGSEAKAMFGDLLAALESGEVRFGAGRTRGLGRLRLSAAAEVKKETLNKCNGILEALRGKSPAVTLPTLGRSRPRLVATVDWRPDGPLMVKSGLDGVGVDMLPLLSAVAGALAPVLPGSSVKGALRNQAERVVRTVLGCRALHDLDGKERFLAHTRVPLVEELFGSPGRGKKEKEERSEGESREGRLGLGALAVDDCYAKDLRIPRERWQRVIRAAPDAGEGQSESELRRVLDESPSPLTHWTAGYHVAVDRWTGGAADGFLYTVLEPHDVAWEPLTLEIDVARLERLGCAAEALALLLFVLRDLSAGRIPLGFATLRGMGAVAVSGVTFTAAGCGETFQQLDKTTLTGEGLGGLPAALRANLNQRWQAWVMANQEAVP